MGKANVAREERKKKKEKSGGEGWGEGVSIAVGYKANDKLKKQDTRNLQYEE